MFKYISHANNSFIVIDGEERVGRLTKYPWSKEWKLYDAKPGGLGYIELRRLYNKLYMLNKKERKL